MHTADKIAPALAVGNAVVLKPPEQTPSVVLRMVELIQSVLTCRAPLAARGARQVKGGPAPCSSTTTSGSRSGRASVGSDTAASAEHAEETLSEYAYTKTIRWAAKCEELPYWTAASRVLEG
nr:aldehyde dehydrogenase family protein [Mycobacterium tilburgii]